MGSLYSDLQQLTIIIQKSCQLRAYSDSVGNFINRNIHLSIFLSYPIHHLQYLLYNGSRTGNNGTRRIQCDLLSVHLITIHKLRFPCDEHPE